MLLTTVPCRLGAYSNAYAHAIGCSDESGGEARMTAAHAAGVSLDAGERIFRALVPAERV